MPYSRQPPKIAPTGRVTLQLSTAQRDLFVQSDRTPRGLIHELRRAPVREGKLSVRVTQASLAALIEAVAAMNAPDRRAEKALDSLMRYLESLEERFGPPADEETETN